MELKIKTKRDYSTELAVALDCSTQAEAESILADLDSLPVVYKIGSELFSVLGSSWVKSQSRSGKRIFLDLKFHDIPNTVIRAALQACEMGAEFFTVHLAGGPRMLQPLKEEMTKSFGEKIPQILGVSVLTSYDQVTWDEVTFAMSGVKSPIADSVRRLAMQARFWGVDGIVCSSKELKMIRKIDPHLKTVVPGIRPRGSNPKDQARVTTPYEAAKNGAHLIVVGRPISESKNRRETVEKILKDISKFPAESGKQNS